MEDVIEGELAKYWMKRLLIPYYFRNGACTFFAIASGPIFDRFNVKNYYSKINSKHKLECSLLLDILL